jgi:hypothetical protein
MEYEKNITKETIMSCLNFCESLGERKINTVKKGLVVKPIISLEL